MVTSVCVVETTTGAAPAAPAASATATAMTPLSFVHLRNACGIHVDGEVRSPHRLRAEVVGGRSPDSSGGAAPQIESPQNRHLDLLAVVNCHAKQGVCQNWARCSGNCPNDRCQRPGSRPVAAFWRPRESESELFGYVPLRLDEPPDAGALTVK
jgi:hypothetical protein